MSKNQILSRRNHSDAQCATCTRMFSELGMQGLSSRNGFAHHTRTECTVSKNEGCPLCQLIFEIVSGARGDRWTGDDRVTLWNKSSVTGSKTSGFDMLEGGVADEPDIIKIYLFAKAADPAAALVRRRPLRRNVRSKAVFSAAKKLIHSCMQPKEPSKGHQQCRYSRDTVLPTRVLDLGNSESPSSVLHLQVNEMETHGSYLALSYCWGKPDPTAKSQPVLLRKNNLHEFTSGIRIENLPQSIQDAILVTRKLGFRYLWVDALCIIQDDGKDKDQEISKMSNIYKNAAITVAASVAEKSSDGFLQSRGKKSTSYLPDCKLTIPMPNSQVGTIYLSARAYEPDHPLDKRGWVLQEFMLSSRMLIFSDYELLWQCKEVDLQSVTGGVGGLRYLQPLESLPWAAFEDDAEPYFGSLDFDKLYLWKTIIHQYTDRELTDQDDRLRAVAGIINELEKQWRDTNIYGHWKRWFVQLLAWYKPEVDRVEKRYLQRAPSWSWVSVDGGIQYEEPLEIEDARVKTVTVAMVVLTCRVLHYHDIDSDKTNSVSERPDLANPAATRELGDKECAYLLLGKMRVHTGCEKGVGLLVLKTASRQYRRFGLVIFKDMSIWEGIEAREITFEPNTK